MAGSYTICWTDRVGAPDPAGMNRVPALWAAAYSPRRSAPVRAVARQLVRLRCLLRALALADHTYFGGY